MNHQKYKDREILEIKNIEERYKIEENFLNMLSSGDYSKAMSAYNALCSMKLDGRNMDSYQDAKYLAIVLGTLCRKTLQHRNKVHPYYLNSVSKEMAMDINNTETADDIRNVSKKFIKKYCLLAKNHSLHQYSEVVHKSISYIEIHYADELSLSILASNLHVTKNYLSAVFKKQLGKTVTEFIHEVRTDKAIFLLNSTKLPINDISIVCGYEDSNYFCRVFKRRYKISPRQYRNNLFNK